MVSLKDFISKYSHPEVLGDGTSACVLAGPALHLEKQGPSPFQPQSLVLCNWGHSEGHSLVVMNFGVTHTLLCTGAQGMGGAWPALE